MVPLMRTVQNNQLFRDRKWTSGCLGLERGECRVAVNGYGLFFWSGENVQELDIVMGAHNSDTLKTT